MPSCMSLILARLRIKFQFSLMSFNIRMQILAQNRPVSLDKPLQGKFVRNQFASKVALITFILDRWHKHPTARLPAKSSRKRDKNPKLITPPWGCPLPGPGTHNSCKYMVSINDGSKNAYPPRSEDEVTNFLFLRYLNSWCAFVLGLIEQKN